MLGFGTLEFSSASTGGIEVTWHNVNKPYRIKKEEIEKMQDL